MRWQIESPESDIHVKLVDAWEKANTKGLSLMEHAQLLIKAVSAIEERTLQTLSSVTLLVITDRVLNQGKEIFPFLSDVKIELGRMCFDQLITKYENDKSDELLEGLRTILVLLLTVLGRVTGDILVAPLHNEVLKVTWDFQNNSNHKPRRKDENPTH